MTRGWQVAAIALVAGCGRIAFDGVGGRREDDAGIDAAGPSSLTIAQDPWNIGCDTDNGSPVALLAGAIDEVRIYDRALTRAEVAALAVK